MNDEAIKDRIRFVVGMPERTDLAGMVEHSLANAKVYNPSNCLRSACSTEAEEERAWKILRDVRGASARSIEAARKVVEKQLVEKFGIKPDWDRINRPISRVS